MSKLIAVAALILALGAGTYVFACACCAENGTYFSSTSQIDDYEREILSKMEYAPTSSLYLDAAGFEMVKGLEALRLISESSDSWSEFDSINTRVGVVPSLWAFAFWLKEAEGGLSLRIPAEREYYAADIHDGRRSPGGGPLLYKELRFRGKVGSGTGMFADGLKNGAEYFLLFQGRGNGCNNVEDFNHWRLSVNGPDARYTFYGKLTSGKTLETDQEAVVPAPTFEEHKVEEWNGRKRALNLSSHPDARMFRTRLREAWAGEVNFAGHYIFTYWGCGTNCLVGAVIDAKTGKVYFPAELQGMGVGLPGTDFEREPFELRRDSDLFIFYGTLANGEGPATAWLKWDRSRFVELARKPIGDDR